MIQVANSPPPGAPPKAPTPGSNFLSTSEGELSIVVIGLGLAVIMALSVILYKKDATADSAIRAYALILIITGTIVLICAGYSNDQIAPAMGLFGTVAGYLLGRKANE